MSTMNFAAQIMQQMLGMGLAVTKQEALWEACGYGHIDRVKALIEEGIDVNWVSYTHNCCAIHVASQGKSEIVRLLLEANCNVNVKDDRGNLALHHAAMKGEGEIMQTLITAGSQIDTPDKNGWTPLINAAYWCQPEAVRVLLKNRACPHLQNKDDRTALHEACRSQAEHEEELAEIVTMLIDAGCDLNAKSSDLGWADFTPLMFSAYWGHNDISKVLIKNGCELNSQGSNGWTALHWAANTDREDIIETLLEAGVDPNIAGYRGEYGMDVTKSDTIKERLSSITTRKEIYRPVEKPKIPASTNGEVNTRAENMNQNQNRASWAESMKNEQIEIRKDLHRKLQFRQDKRRRQILRQNEDSNRMSYNDDRIKAMDDEDDDEDTSLSTLSSATKTENGNITPGSIGSDLEGDNANNEAPKKERIPYFFEEELEKMLAENVDDPKEEEDEEKVEEKDDEVSN